MQLHIEKTLQAGTYFFNGQESCPACICRLLCRLDFLWRRFLAFDSISGASGKFVADFGHRDFCRGLSDWISGLICSGWVWTQGMDDEPDADAFFTGNRANNCYIVKAMDNSYRNCGNGNLDTGKEIILWHKKL